MSAKKKGRTVWECVQGDDFCTEYDAYVDESNGYDVFHRLTLVHDKQTAYMTISVMDEGGTIPDDEAYASLAIPYDVAVKMTGHRVARIAVQGGERA